MAVVKRVSSPPIGALTDCFSAIRGGQFSALNNKPEGVMREHLRPPFPEVRGRLRDGAPLDDPELPLVWAARMT